MQTRSMVRKALSRSASLDARPLPSVSEPMELIATEPMELAIRPPDPVEVVSSEVARVDHGGDSEVVVHARVQQDVMNMMQAQAFVQVANQHHTEARLHQAFLETEKRLHATAQALVEAHAKEQASETRRDLGEAIQRALVDAHSQAHQQAMQAAHERLSKFTKDIEDQIKKKLTDAVNEVGTKGVAYIEDVTAKRLALLRGSTQEEIEKFVKDALAQTPSQQPLQITNGSSELNRQLLQIQDDLPGQLAAIEKRCTDGAVSSASAQAERIVNQAEVRLLTDIDRRLTEVESRADSAISDAVSRAEAHCNIVDKRTTDSVERALKELRASRQLRTEVYVDRVLDEKLQAAVEKHIAVNSATTIGAMLEAQARPLVERLAHETMNARLLERPLLVNGVEQQHSASSQDHVRGIVEEVVRVQLSQETSLLTTRIAGITRTMIHALLDLEMRARIEPAVTNVAQQILTQTLETVVKPAVNQVVAEAKSQFDAHVDRQLRLIGDLKPHVPQPIYLAPATNAAFAQPAWTPAPVASVPPPIVDERATRELKRVFVDRRGNNQSEHSIDFASGSVVNSRVLLASRRSNAKLSFDTQPEPVAPSMLTALHAQELKRFLRAFEQYAKCGGVKAWTVFVEPAILQYLRCVESPEGSSDAQILALLVKKVDGYEQDVAVLEKKFAAIKVDPHASTNREKVESLMIAVENVLVEMGSSGTDPAKTIPLSTLIRVVIDKLPFGLQAQVERRMKFCPPPNTKREFAEMLFSEAGSFTWPTTKIDYKS